ncbi:uncharacterized protein BT62DRAFT_1072490 [Guyanagaster necrorhizus]|uniref:Uncharacterized protein n=1 Tax=Guyanagaster necrorhizus TaxID=856835 RepID=A0A9P8AW96_9AGAR|nr:uncharacterized protein BT62DRAFT_1072490 [Guyanagaster necrorhizus MCA 3950]KAG7450409.1 hypothetical protein BT62DRAFT_1072490 [Guyanagaster necrorhizus MCA 3950]
MASVSTTQTTAVEAPSSFAPSLSFSGSSSTASVPRPLKRHLTSDLDFLAPAAATFKPHPYTPANLANSNLSGSRNRYLHSTRQQNRATSTSPPLTLDVSEKDPDAVFIHPPFESFPGAETFPEGLTYTLMTEHLDWFLDPKDYLPLEGPRFKPDAIPYPPYLEPPRGWCPAKKRDLKDKGLDGWAEGEEPRLRCTFCRRNYAGVNAKSMWRRHVFEKHKVAMSNRREGCERPRGRGSTKENRQPGTSREKTLDSVIGMDVAPQTNAHNTTHKSKFHSLLPVSCSQKDVPTLPLSAENATALRPSPSPPSTPPPMSSSDATTGLSPCPAPFPSSPYDPSLTPSFRHCSPSPPSEHPWRYPSPSHPLHSRQCEISLSDLRSPIIKKDIQNSASPKTGTPEASLRKFSLVCQTLDSKILCPSLPLSFPPSPKELYSPLTGSVTSWRRSSHPNSPFVLDAQLTQHHNLTVTTEDWFPRFEDSLMSTFEPPTKTSVEFTGESPILRSRTLPHDVGLGIGLLEPFTLLDDPSGSEDDDETEVETLIAASHSLAENNSRDASPPFKRRKLVDVLG